MSKFSALICLGLLISSGAAFGTTTLSSFSNYFKTTKVIDPAHIAIYAGNTDRQCKATNSDTPCDSCNDSSAKIMGFSHNLAQFPHGLFCNNQQIHPGLKFSVTVKSTDASLYTNGAPSPLIAIVDGRVFTPDFLIVNPGMAGADITATWSWAKLCSSLSGDSSCTRSFSSDIEVGFSKDMATLAEPGINFQINFRYVSESSPQIFGCGEGLRTFDAFCSFFVYPGNQSVYVDAGANTVSQFLAGDMNYGSRGDFADASGMKYSALRIYYAPGSKFESLSLASPHQDLKIRDSMVLDPGLVKGLQNGVPYAFLSASVDEAGNVVSFADPLAAANSSPMNPAPGLGTTQGAVPRKQK